ncbi:MAG: DsbA family protein, partial [Paracoccaceae bacterium]
RSAGIDPAMIARLLAEDADTDGIRKQDAHARQRGVDGVPFFIIGDLHVVKGAQPSTLWERVIDDIAENRNKQSA